MELTAEELVMDDGRLIAVCFWITALKAISCMRPCRGSKVSGWSFCEGGGGVEGTGDEGSLVKAAATEWEELEEEKLKVCRNCPMTGELSAI